MTTGYIGSGRLTLDPTKMVGKGGEAYVYDVHGVAVKIFKTADDPDYDRLPQEQQAARERLESHQTKLRQFPFRKLPDTVVKPIDLVTNRSGDRILGYSMELLQNVEPLIRFGEKSYRQAGIPNATVMTIFQNLHQTVSQIHAAQVVIGDFNNLNVLIDRQSLARLVDADSMQYGKFVCKLYTTQFVDPRNCDPHQTSPILARPHDRLSDWYSFAAMFMESLLFVRPYGGIYRPKNSAQRVLQDARPLKNISVFNPDVVYPKPATPYRVLPDSLLDIFTKMFEKGWRGEFPYSSLEFNWVRCLNCGTEHARGHCPNCTTAAPSLAKPIIQVRGNVTATYVFRTKGVILFSAYQDGKLCVVYNEESKYLREDGRTILDGDADPQIRYRIQGENTLMAKSGRMVVLNNGVVETVVVDSLGALPLIDANSRNRFWISGGQLRKDGPLGVEEIGSVLENQTLFWVGTTFGFGFYRAGNVTVGFVFNTDRAGINDSVKLGPIRGQLVDSTCVFAKDRCWFMTTTREGTKTVNRCRVITTDGKIEAEAEGTQGDGTWLGSIRGKLAVGNFLLSPTEEGIVRVETASGTVIVTREFPDTEPYVDDNSFLMSGPGGIYVVHGKEIVLLKIS